MNIIWNFINSITANKKSKSYIFLTLTTAICALTGLAIWYFIHFFAFKEISWALCFAGYPGFFIGLIGGVLYIYRHDL